MEPRKDAQESDLNPMARLQAEAYQSALGYIFGGAPSEGVHRTAFAQVATMVESIIVRLEAEGIKFPKWEVHKATLDYAQNSIFLLSGVHTQDRSTHLARRVFNVTPEDIQDLVGQLFAEVYSRRRLGMQESAPDEYEAQMAVLPPDRQFVLHGLVGMGTHERELRERLRTKQGDANELLDQLEFASESYADELNRASLSSEESALVQALISKRVHEAREDEDFLGRLAMSADEVPDYESEQKLKKENDKEEQ